MKSDGLIKWFKIKNIIEKKNHKKTIIKEKVRKIKWGYTYKKILYLGL